MIIQNFYAGLNVVSRNLLDSVASGTFMEITCDTFAKCGTFMEITLGEATKFLDNTMGNYSQCHTERAPTGKKVKLCQRNYYFE